MEVRKLQKTGGSTYVVSLPKSWVKNTGLETGSIVTVRERADSSVIISPGQVSQARKSIFLDADSHIERKLIEKYLLGYDEVKINSKKNFPEKQKSAIKKTAKKLIGFEIMDESAKSLTFKNLLDPAEISVIKSLKRMYTIISVMHRDLITALKNNDKKLLKDVIQRDLEVNRLYFLVVRQIRTMIQNPTLQDKENLKPVDCVDFRLVANLIEVTGDALTSIARKLGTAPSNFKKSNFIKHLQQIHELHEQAAKALFKKDIVLATKAREFHSKLKFNSKDKIPSTFTTDIYHNLFELASCGKDLADIAVSE